MPDASIIKKRKNLCKKQKNLHLECCLDADLFALLWGVIGEGYNSINIGKWKDDKALWQNYHVEQYNDKDWHHYSITDRPLSDEEFKAIADAIEGYLTSESIMEGGWGSVLGNIFDNLSNSLSSNAVFRKETPTSSVGAYTVRCIRE